MEINSQIERKKIQFEKTQSSISCKKFLSSYGELFPNWTKKIQFEKRRYSSTCKFFFSSYGQQFSNWSKKMQFEKTQSFLTCKKFLSSYGVQSQILTKKITIWEGAIMQDTVSGNFPLIETAGSYVY